MFGCLDDIPVCLCSYFCTPVVTSISWARSRDENCNLFHLCCQPACPMWTRANIRKKKCIDGSMMEDCLVYTFCFYCAISQDYRELRNMVLETPRYNAYWQPRDTGFFLPSSTSSRSSTPSRQNSPRPSSRPGISY